MASGIKEYLETKAICAKCGSTISWYGAVGITAITNWLRKSGWSVGTNKIFCPNCRKSRKDRPFS